MSKASDEFITEAEQELATGLIPLDLIPLRDFGSYSAGIPFHWKKNGIQE